MSSSLSSHHRRHGTAAAASRTRAMHPAASTRAGPPPAPASARASAGRRRAAAARASASTSAPPSARRDPAAAPAPTATTTSTLPACVAALTRVDARGRRHEFYVVGTVHTPGSASAAEVRAVVETVRPDAVVLELDQERLDAIVATDLALALATSTSSTRGASYGADFLAGASAAESARALVVLGDAKARSLPDELRRRVFDASARELLDAPRLLRSLTHIPNALGLGLGPGPRGGGAGAVRFPDVVREDPGKLAPLRGPSLVALVALIATAYDAALSGGGGLGGGGDATAATATTLAAASPPLARAPRRHRRRVRRRRAARLRTRRGGAAAGPRRRPRRRVRESRVRVRWRRPRRASTRAARLPRGRGDDGGARARRGPAGDPVLHAQAADGARGGAATELVRAAVAGVDGPRRARKRRKPRRRRARVRARREPSVRLPGVARRRSGRRERRRRESRRRERRRRERRDGAVRGLSGRAVAAAREGCVLRGGKTRRHRREEARGVREGRRRVDAADGARVERAPGGGTWSRTSRARSATRRRRRRGRRTRATRRRRGRCASSGWRTATASSRGCPPCRCDGRGSGTLRVFSIIRFLLHG